MLNDRVRLKQRQLGLRSRPAVRSLADLLQHESESGDEQRISERVGPQSDQLVALWHFLNLPLSA